MEIKYNEPYLTLVATTPEEEKILSDMNRRLDAGQRLRGDYSLCFSKISWSDGREEDHASEIEFKVIHHDS